MNEENDLWIILTNLVGICINMLYHFPNESPEELQEKERLYLEKEIKRASRVEKFGYRKKECTLPSLYIEWRCIHEYLKCPIEKWKLPKSSKEKIQLEPLPTEFLHPMLLSKPLKYFNTETKENIRRIVGYREIQQKREYVEYLKDVELSEGVDLNKDELRTAEAGGDYSSEGYQDQEEREVETDVSEKILEFLKLARGGGKSKSGKKKGGKKQGKEGKVKDKDKSKKKKKDTKTTIENKEAGKGGGGGGVKGILSQIKNLFGAGGTGKGDDKKKATKRKWGFFNAKEIKKRAAQLEKENKRNLEEIFKYHHLFRVPAQKERDNEWLQLSDSDPEAKSEAIQTFNKQLLPWMKEGLSYESQFLAKTLKPFMFLLDLTGRSFMSTKADYIKKHVDFIQRRRDLLFFFLTSFFFWVCFVMVIASFFTIQWENQQYSTERELALDTIEGLDLAVAKARHLVEELELTKYKIPLMVVMINLSLTAIWSILIILGDGIYVCHYFNCWTAALAEMETSGSIGIRKQIVRTCVFFSFYAIVMICSFYNDYPKHTRFSSGLITSLIMRSFQPHTRLHSDAELLPYQMAGLAFQIYVTYCASMSKLLMQILAIVLKNSSEMWNFKFALTFEQLAAKGRGHVLKLSLNHSLVKLFTDHRILTVLLRNFGEVFAISILIYMVSEMGVLTLTLVEMFFYQPGTPEKFGGSDHVMVMSSNNSETAPPLITIPYYHTPAEDYCMFFLMSVQIIVQYLNTSEILARAGASFFAGYEFVRRSGTILCRTSHQRRLIQSLEWSFSSTNPSVLSANGFFAINREAILSAFAAVVGFFSLIIQLQVQKKEIRIEFLTEADCSKFKDLVLVLGACELAFKDASHEDLSGDFHMINDTQNDQ